MRIIFLKDNRQLKEIGNPVKEVCRIQESLLR